MNPNIFTPDYLRPIRSGNRDEYFLIEFHRVFKNTNMSILRNMLERSQDDEEILQLFPNLIEYAKMPIDALYNVTVMYNHPEQFVFNLSKETLSMDMCRSFVEVFREPYHFEYLHTTRMEAILRNLIEQQFVKKVYLIADRFTTEMKSYLSSTIEPKYLGTKVSAIEGNLIDAFDSIPELTTVFMSDSCDFETLYQYNSELVKNKFFVIYDGYDNLEPVDPNDPQSRMQYAKTELINRLAKDRICEVAYAYPFCIDKETE